MIIGLTGRAGSGKSTVAQMLVDDYGFTQFALADPMRSAMLELDPWIPDDNGYCLGRLSMIVDDFGWDRAKRTFPEVRRLLQKFGTEAGRDVHGEDCWIEALARTIPPTVDDIVISDVRFDNEARWVRARGFVIKIERDQALELGTHHASEQGVDPSFVFETVANHWSLNVTRADVDRVMRLLKLVADD